MRKPQENNLITLHIDCYKLPDGRWQLSITQNFSESLTEEEKQRATDLKHIYDKIILKDKAVELQLIETKANIFGVIMGFCLKNAGITKIFDDLFTNMSSQYLELLQESEEDNDDA